MKLSNTINIRVRYAETDQMKVVYYSNYFVYFESGRSELLRSIGLPYTEMEKLGYLLPVIEAHARYYKSASYDDILEIKTILEETNNIKIKLSYEVRLKSNGDLVAEGYTIHGFVDSKTRKPRRAPDIFTNAINKYFSS